MQIYEIFIYSGMFQVEIVIANNKEWIVWQSGAVSCYALQSFFRQKASKKDFHFYQG